MEKPDLVQKSLPWSQGPRVWRSSESKLLELHSLELLPLRDVWRHRVPSEVKGQRCLEQQRHPSAEQPPGDAAFLLQQDQNLLSGPGLDTEGSWENLSFQTG